MKKFGLILLLLLVSVFVMTQINAASPIKVVIWEQDDPTGDELMDKWAQEINKLYPDIVVERVHYSTEDLRSNFQTAALAGKGPHLVYGPYDNIGPFVTMGIIQPLDNFVPKDFLAKFDPTALKGNMYQGKLWALPDRIGNHLCLLYNKKLVKVVPRDMDTFIKLAKSLTKDINKDGKIDQWGLVYNLNEPYWLPPFLGGFGGWVMDDNANPTLNTDAMVKALQLVQDFKFKHKIVPPDCDYNLADTLFKEGKAAFLINGPWSFAGYVEAKVDFGVTRIPKINETGLWPTPMSGMKGYSVSKIVTDPKEKDAVLKVLMYFTDEKAQKEMLRKVKWLPTNKNALKDPFINEDPILKGSAYQLEVAKPMPIVPEMRAIWDAIRGPQELVMAGKMTPKDAAEAMQKDAEKRIKEMLGK